MVSSPCECLSALVYGRGDRTRPSAVHVTLSKARGVARGVGFSSSTAPGQRSYSAQPSPTSRPVATFLKTTEISIDGAHTLPREYYTAPDIYAQEMDRIFHGRWLCVGREDRIPGAGDYVLQQ